MSTNKTIQNITRAIVTAPQRVIHYVFSAVSRIFSPSDDNYPATGIQPFDGDSADKKSL